MPAPRRNAAPFMALRATSWNVIRRNQHLYDTAVRFGMVPMAPPYMLRNLQKLIFHLVFSTSKSNKVSIYRSSKTISGAFNWRHWRGIESIFHHHPSAEVRVHSNTLPEDTFDVLKEAGYSIAVHRYCLRDMLRDSVAEGFVKKLGKASIGPYWYSHLTCYACFSCTLTAVYTWTLISSW